MLHKEVLYRFHAVCMAFAPQATCNVLNAASGSIVTLLQTPLQCCLHFVGTRNSFGVFCHSVLLGGLLLGWPLAVHDWLL